MTATSGIQLISNERERQIEQEGYSLESDQQYCPGVLSEAAACYTIFASYNPEQRQNARSEGLDETLSKYWPFTPDYWKPGQTDSKEERIRELTKAGALIAAEIDRLIQE